MNTRKLSNYLSRWCKANGFDVSIRYGSDFAYHPIKDIIRYSFCVDDTQDKLFKQVFITEGLLCKCDTFVLSFFHELGHYMTDDNWSDKESMMFMENKSKLDGAILEDNLTYFYMPDEIMATKWAIDYINNNTDILKKFWADVKELILNIYTELGYDGV